MTSRHRGRRDQAARAALRPLVRSGLAVCGRCGRPLPADIPEDQWDAGHVEDLVTGGDPAGPRQPEHADCNRRAGAIVGNAKRRGARTRLAKWLAFFPAAHLVNTPRCPFFLPTEPGVLTRNPRTPIRLMRYQART